MTRHPPTLTFWRLRADLAHPPVLAGDVAAQWLERLIARKGKEQEVNTNEYYRNEVRRDLAPRLARICDAFGRELAAVDNGATFGQRTLQQFRGDIAELKQYAGQLLGRTPADQPLREIVAKIAEGARVVKETTDADAPTATPADARAWLIVAMTWRDALADALPELARDASRKAVSA
jgi:hypothetical protein